MEPNSEHEPVTKRLAKGLPVSDAEFDRIFPARLREHSKVHWTSVRSALIASRHACFRPGVRVLDVGSGVGKFCIVGALTNPGASFHGVEQRGTHAAAAKETVRNYAIPGTTFTHGNAEDIDWNRYDALYFYNPFWEHIDARKRIDDAIPLHGGTFSHYVTMTYRRLATLKSGTRVILFNGFGGDIPENFRLLHQEKIKHLELKVWEKI